MSADYTTLEVQLHWRLHCPHCNNVT